MTCIVLGFLLLHFGTIPIQRQVTGRVADDRKADRFDKSLSNGLLTVVMAMFVALVLQNQSEFSGRPQVVALIGAAICLILTGWTDLAIEFRPSVTALAKGRTVMYVSTIAAALSVCIATFIPSLGA